MERLKCEIERVTYANADSGWAVMKVSVPGYNVPVTLVGPLADVTAGATVEVEGEWKTDPRFGRQFAASSWQEVMPATTEGLVRYLGSGMLYGVGPHFARLIVDRFGMDTLQVLDNDIERLLETPKLGKKKLERIAASWERQKGVRSVSLFLQQHGVSATYASKIYGVYGDDTVARVKSDPYRLADDVWGIGFRYADGIATSLGYVKDDPRRLRSGLLHTLTRRGESEGDVYLERDSLIAQAAALLGVEGDAVSAALDVAVREKDVIADGEAVYLPYYYHAERGSARRLLAMVATESDIDSDEAEEYINKVEAMSRRKGVEYDEAQIEAVRMALTRHVMVLTGGPGTGKTTTTRAIIDALTAAGRKIRLAAPTGRAAKRMAETTGMEAVTLHRLLEYSPVGGYGRDEDNPLEGDVLIVDECSMIDLTLFYRVLRALPVDMRLVMVGDIDQLPSVGAGNVLHDIIASGRVPVTRLTRIFRQAQTSRIIMNAHAINRGCMPDMSNGRQTDFFFINVADTSKLGETVCGLVAERLPKAYGVHPKDIQVLTPMHKGEAGAIALNMLLQERLTPGGDEVEAGGRVFRRGDKVMQIRNNYDKNVFNGDIGFVTDVDRKGRTLTVDFDGNRVEYESSELDELTAAYGVTIHKSQGCEFDVVVIVVTRRHAVMLQRNLLYTAITRARKICVLVGDMAGVRMAVDNACASSRNSRLCARLRE